MVKTCSLLFQNLGHKVIDDWKEDSECILEHIKSNLTMKQLLRQWVGFSSLEVFKWRLNSDLIEMV